MPDTFVNPYATSPIGDALKRLSTTLMSGPDEATRILRAEQALKAKSINENTPMVGDMFRKYGTPGFDRNAAMDYAIRAGIDPSVLSGYERYGAANTFGAQDPRTTNAAVGAGGAYSGTYAGFTTDQNNQNLRAANTLAETNRHNVATETENARQFNQKPMTVGGDTGPVIVPQQDAYGKPAVEDLNKVRGDAARRVLNSPGGLAGADDATQRFIGVEGKGQQTPRNYVFNGKNYITYDGVSDVNGHPLPAGGYLANAQGPADSVGLTNGVKGNLQGQDISGQQFKSLLNYTRGIAQKDPNNFGVPGFVKGVAQDVAQVAGGVAQGLGYPQVQDAVNAVRQKAAQNGVNPQLLSGVFDPNLPALHTAADLLVFSAAEALAGQNGRSVSDKDVKLIRDITGDPREWMTSQEKYLSKLETLDQILGLRQGVIDQNLRPAPSPSGAPAAPGANPPNPPTAPGAPSNVEKWDYVNGVLTKVN